VQDIVTGLPHVQAGTLRPLGVFSPKRPKALPNAPTIAEQGYRIDTPMIYGLVGPKDTPGPIVAALSSAAAKVLENHKAYLVERFDKLGAEIHYLAPQEYGAALRRQNDFFAKIVKELNP